MITYQLLAALMFAISSSSNLKMAKFCANLSFLFTESSFLERYQLAKTAGFKCVETGFPYGISKEQVAEAKNAASIEQVLINIYTGDVTKGELGFAAIPGKEQDFKDSLKTSIDFAKALGARKLHIMAGKIDGDITKAHHDVYEKNLAYATGLLEKENILALIEPINNYSVPNYYMNSYKRAVEVIDKIGSPNLKIMFDIFHLQHIQGDISATIKKLFKYIGHVQIAQVPHRHEPSVSGELNYEYILQLLEKEGYNDWISLEYKPKNDTVNGLKWIKEMGYAL